MKEHPLLGRWKQIIQRCTNPNNKNYNTYGGAGITVCDRWLMFDNFVTDMLPAFQDGLTLERKNNQLGYSPENCCWASRFQQAQNRKQKQATKLIYGKTLQEIAATTSLSERAIAYRFKKGWTLEKIMLPRTRMSGKF